MTTYDDGSDRGDEPTGGSGLATPHDDPLMDWSLAEQLGGAEPPDLLAGVQAQLEAQPVPRARATTWLAAAMLLFGTFVVFGVAWWSKPEPDARSTPMPTQEPAPEPVPVYVHDVASAAALPIGTLAVEVVGGDDAVIAALARLRELQVLRVREPWNESFGLGLKTVAPAAPPHVTAASWPILLGFPKLRRLELSGAVRAGRIDPARRAAFADALEALPLLTSLTMRCMDTDDEVLGLLARARSLRELDLSFNHGFVEDGVVALLGCRTLRRLSLRGCQQLHDRVLARLAELPELQQLDLSAIDGMSWRSGTEEDDEIGRAIRQRAQQHADRLGMGPGAQTLEAIGAAQRLHALDIGGGHWSSSQLALLGGSGRERAVGAGGMRVLGAFGGQVDGIDFVAGLPPGLESLELCGDYTDDLPVAIAAHLPNLRHLSLAACDRITDRGIAALRAMRQLRSLDLRQMRGLSAATVDTLADMAQLEELDLRHCPFVTDEHRTRLRTLPRLRVFDAEPLAAQRR